MEDANGELFAARHAATLGAAMARQRMGQHFLGEVSWQKRILGTLPLSPNETWIEIGAGHGEMTQLLAAEGRRLIAVEADARLAEELKDRVATHPDKWPGVEVVAGDILDLDLAKAAGGLFHVYGNLPYYISSPILHRLFECAGRIDSIHVVIQMEVAERIVAPPGRRTYGYLSVACQFYTKPEISLRIPPGAFRPPPRVTSALVTMKLPGERVTLGINGERRFLEFVQVCFGQKRKTLRNNLREMASAEQVHDVLTACGLRPDARAEQLNLGQFAALFAALRQKSQ